MIYVLSTQCLLDLLVGEKYILDWIAKVRLQQVEISAVSIGQALDTITRDITDPAQRKNFERELGNIVTAAQIHQRVIPFTDETARIWADLLGRKLPCTTPGGGTDDLSAASRMVVATALQRGASLVDKPQPYHATIPDLNVTHP
jgi:predicted nucleic acid-binding protein